LCSWNPWLFYNNLLALSSSVFNIRKLRNS
jgi:hypothetical protein